MYSNGGIYIPDRKPPMGALLNPYLMINRGLVCSPIMWEGAGGTVEDSSGNGNTGTFGAGAVSPAWISGKYGSCLYFDGGDYALIPSSASLQFSGDITIAFQVILNGTGNQRVISKRGAAGTSYDIWYDGGGEWKIYDGTNIPRLAGVAINVLQHHIIVVKNSVLSWYINGISQTVNDTTTFTNSSTTVDIQVGRYFGELYYLTGKLDIPMIYNRALSPSEIAQLYREPFCGFRWASIEQLYAYVAAAGGTILPQITTAYMRLSA